LYDGNDALQIGTCVHEMCEVYVKGGDPTAHLDAVMEKAETLDKSAFRAQVVSAYSAFEFWCKGTQLEILECEVPVLSETHRYGGTLDFIGRLNGRLVLGDFKTSGGVYPEYLIQLVAYAKAYEECKGVKIDGGYHLLRFSKENGDFGHHFYPKPRRRCVARVSRICGRCMNLNEKLKKRAA
jgi:ATP-dependent exoDNAse (exonuclease V) beta subunit